MWLVLDIGNSAVKGGLFQGQTLHETFRLPVDRTAPASVWREALRAALDGRAVSRVGIASVVPGLTAALRTFLEGELGLRTEVLHHEMRLPFALAYETPHTLGLDRLAAAAAAYALYGAGADGAGRSVVAVDAGTAVTYEVVDRARVYRGGAIGPGPLLLRHALHHGTAQLPEVPLEVPHRPIGRSTREALQAGILFGFLDSVRGMLGRVAEELGEAPFVVATGGWAPLLAEHLTAIGRVEPHLVLHGIRVLLALQPGEGAGG